MRRRFPLVVLFLVFTLVATGTVVTHASPSPDPKKNKKKAATEPLLAQALSRQAYVFMQQERWDEALDRFRDAEAANPGNATVYTMI